MSIWFFDNLERLRVERAAITNLEHNSPWLLSTRWGLRAPQLCLYARIEAHGKQYEVDILYPEHFPQAPPMVSPVDRQQRWSTHQYVDGTLCLEYGPDTWHPDLTGADMLASTYRLLHAENPQGSTQIEPLPSRHSLTLGQELRGRFGRCFVSREAAAQLLSEHIPGHGVISVATFLQRNCLTDILTSVQPAGGTVWSDPSVPSLARQGTVAPSRGAYFKTRVPPDVMVQLSTFDGLRDLLSEQGFDTPILERIPDPDSSGSVGPAKVILLVDSASNIHLFARYPPDNTVYRRTPITLTTNSGSRRSPTTFESLAAKTVAIIGLGSLGSKVAVTLARSGVGHLILVDDDIVLPENLVRNDLDWRDVGQHKVDAVAAKIELISPIADVLSFRMNLLGQENPACYSALLSRIAGSDLVVDLTASAHVFNLLTAITMDSGVSLVWAEVFEGGIGGLLARSRPALDPEPQYMRAALLRYSEGTDYVRSRPPEAYASTTKDGNVLVAGDADCSAIAALTSKMCVDTLTKATPSAFRHSLYLVGLSREWIFEQALHVKPIQVEDPSQSRRVATAPVTFSEDDKKFFTDLTEDPA